MTTRPDMSSCGAVSVAAWGSSLRLLRGRAGQTTGEYALVAGGVALGCIVAVLFLGDGIGGLFGSNAKRIPAGVFTPPVSGNVTFPASATTTA